MIRMSFFIGRGGRPLCSFHYHAELCQHLVRSILPFSSFDNCVTVVDVAVFRDHLTFWKAQPRNAWVLHKSVYLKKIGNIQAII